MYAVKHGHLDIVKCLLKTEVIDIHAVTKVPNLSVHDFLASA